MADKILAEKIKSSTGEDIFSSFLTQPDEIRIQFSGTGLEINVTSMENLDNRKEVLDFIWSYPMAFKVDQLVEVYVYGLPAGRGTLRYDQNNGTYEVMLWSMAPTGLNEIEGQELDEASAEYMDTLRLNRVRKLLNQIFVPEDTVHMLIHMFNQREIDELVNDKKLMKRIVDVMDSNFLFFTSEIDLLANIMSLLDLPLETKLSHLRESGRSIEYGDVRKMLLSTEEGKLLDVSLSEIFELDDNLRIKDLQKTGAARRKWLEESRESENMTRSDVPSNLLFDPVYDDHSYFPSSKYLNIQKETSQESVSSAWKKYQLFRSLMMSYGNPYGAYYRYEERPPIILDAYNSMPAEYKDDPGVTYNVVPLYEEYADKSLTPENRHVLPKNYKDQIYEYGSHLEGEKNFVMKQFEVDAVKVAFEVMDLSEKTLKTESDKLFKDEANKIFDSLKEEDSHFRWMEQYRNDRWREVKNGDLKASEAHELIFSQRKAVIDAIRSRVGAKHPIMYDPDIDISEWYYNRHRRIHSDDIDVKFREHLEEVIAGKLKSIYKFKRVLLENPEKIWLLEGLINLTKQRTQLIDSALVNQWIDTKANAEETLNTIAQLGMAALSIGLAIISSGSLSGVGLVMVSATAAGVSAVDAYMTYDDYTTMSNANNINVYDTDKFTIKDPSVIWVIASAAGVFADAASFAKLADAAVLAKVGGVVDVEKLMDHVNDAAGGFKYLAGMKFDDIRLAFDKVRVFRKQLFWKVSEALKDEISYGTDMLEALDRFMFEILHGDPKKFQTVLAGDGTLNVFMPDNIGQKFRTFLFKDTVRKHTGKAVQTLGEAVGSTAPKAARAVDETTDVLLKIGDLNNTGRKASLRFSRQLDALAKGGKHERILELSDLLKRIDTANLSADEIYRIAFKLDMDATVSIPAIRQIISNVHVSPSARSLIIEKLGKPWFGAREVTFFGGEYLKLGQSAREAMDLALASPGKSVVNLLDTAQKYKSTHVTWSQAIEQASKFTKTVRSSTFRPQSFEELREFIDVPSKYEHLFEAHHLIHFKIQDSAPDLQRFFKKLKIAGFNIDEARHNGILLLKEDYSAILKKYPDITEEFPRIDLWKELPVHNGPHPRETIRQIRNRVLSIYEDYSATNNLYQAVEDMQKLTISIFDDMKSGTLPITKKM